MFIAYVAADLNNIKIISACCFHFPDKVTETNINSRNHDETKSTEKGFLLFFFFNKTKT